MEAAKKNKKKTCRSRPSRFDVRSREHGPTTSGPTPTEVKKLKGETTMRCMVFVKASKESEAGVLPSTELLTNMGKFNEELVKAGVMLAGEGLQPSSKGKRISFTGAQ